MAGLVDAQTPTVYLVRHGKTDWNSGQASAERFRSTEDVPLNAEGKAQAKKLASSLSDKGITDVFSSDLSRAKDTALAIAHTAHADVHVTPGLRPWNLGKMTGTPVSKDAIKKLNDLAENHPDESLPGGESFDKWKETFHTTLDKILDKATQSNGTYAIVTHTRGLQLIKGSEKTESGLSDHEINMTEFGNYTHELHTAEYLTLRYRNGEWKMEKESGK